MALVFGGIAPHPPIMVPAVGGGEARKVQKSQEAMARLAEGVKNSGADTLVIISPHSPLFRDAIAINLDPDLQGDLGQFRAPQVKAVFRNDLALAQAISEKAARRNIDTVGLDREAARSYNIGTELDHGVTVPLYFLVEAGVDISLVSLAMAPFSREELYAFGIALREAAESLGRKIAIIASGDLSHRLIPGAPAGYDPEGEIFDRQIVEAVGQGDVDKILNLPEELAEKAGECGLRPIIILHGAFDGWDYKPEVLSYEGPFGVGYLVAVLTPVKYSGSGRLEEMKKAREEQMAQHREKESEFVQLARTSLEHYVRKGKQMPLPEVIPPAMKDMAGVFVSLKKHGQLRGCIGTIEPTAPNIASEIIQNAVSAGAADPRFLPVEENELNDITYSVDVLKPPEPIESIDQLDPGKYGVIVRKGARKGLLLPNLEGIDSAEEQVAIACQKAGIGQGEDVKLERFEVIRYK